MAGNLTLDPEIEDVLAGLREFVRSEVAPREEKLRVLLDDPRRTYDASGRYVPEIQAARREIRMASSAAGYYQMLTPESLGGGGGGAVLLLAVFEELFRFGGTHHWLAFDSVAHWSTGPSHIFGQTSEVVRAQAWPGILSGERTICFAMSEPEAGSDVWKMSTIARPEGDGFVISGSKQWITNGPYADYALIFAVTDLEQARARSGGITAFLVPTDQPGFRVASVIKMFGHLGSGEAILEFEDLPVSRDWIIGEMSRGLDLGLQGTALGRLYNTGRCVGIARWALDQAAAYARDRHTFGRRIADHQGVSFPLAERATEVLAAHLLGLHAARLFDAGQDAVSEAAMAKLYATEMATRVVDTAAQTLGAMGFTNEIGFSEAWQTARVVQVADGSSQMLKRLIASRLTRGQVSL
jgi:acyl-CoA dehydrogenase